MAHKHQYLVYYIHLSNKALYDSLAHTGSPDTIGAVLAAPDRVATDMGIPKLAKTAAFVAPSITSEWFGTEDHFPTDVDAFDRKSGGWFGIPLLFGDTTTYHWRGQYTYSPPAAVPGVSVPINIATVKWLDGFELADGGQTGVQGPENNKSGDANTNNDNRYCVPGSSRHVDGAGFAWRSSALVRRHHPTENGGALAQSCWERLYVRLLLPPAASTRLWTTYSSTGVEGWTLDVLPSGQLAYGWQDTAFGAHVVGTVAALPIGVWKKLDLRFWYGAVGVGGNQFELWINGVQVVTANGLGSTILPTGPNVGGLLHGSSFLGNNQANTLAIDLDDWTAWTHQGSPDGVDFQNGTRVLQIRATGFDAATANMTGDYRWTLLNPVGDAGAVGITSAVNGAVLAVTTDAAGADALPESLGAVALLVQLDVAAGGTGPGTLAVTGGGALTFAATAVPVVNAIEWKRAMTGLAGTPTPVKPLAPLVLKYVKTSALAQTLKRFSATVALIGSFGPEDLGPLAPPPSVLPARTGPHNHPYPRTPWARLTIPPIQPVFIRAGTYVGNGTGQDLTFPSPIHFFRTRSQSAANAGTLWWSSMMGSHLGPTIGIDATGVVQAAMNDSFVPAGVDTIQQQCVIRIVGANPANNANGVTYAYIAIGDPGQRYMTNGDLRSTVAGSTGDVVTPLLSPTFTPQAVFIQHEDLGGAASAGLFKGLGSSAGAVANLSGVAETANALTLAAGSLTTKTALYALTLGPSPPFSAWRTDDGSSDDVGSNKGKVVQITTYTGDGAASRSVALLPAVGKRPVWAIVVPHNASPTYFRDAGHAALAASRWDTGASSVTAIVGGGLDTLSVGIALNANGVVYDVLAIPGDSVAGNDGFSIAGDFWPVPPDPPPGAPGPEAGPEPGEAPAEEPPPDVVLSDPLPPTGPMPGLTDDLAAACTADTHRLINLALSRIGVSKQIVNVATDATREAVAARLVYAEAIQTTLRDFPWPFATRYVQLTVVNAGARPNSDWRYVYRQPNDCLFERRLVVSRTDVANPDGVPFQLSSDFDPGDALAVPPVPASGGGLIFCNLPNAVLEYTARPKCPLTKSEPLFRDAAAWKLAEMIGPSLSKIADSAVLCAKAYQGAIDQAYLVLRPGNAGDVPATATIDTSAAAQAANLAVANTALIQIGAKTIRNLTSDQSREAQLVRIVFEQELRATLRDYPWPFATVYVTPALVGGTSAVAVNGDWQYSYRLPSDLVFARRLVTQKRRTYDPNPATFKLAKDATGGLLYADAVDAVLEYTNRPEGAVLQADPLFRDALAWRLSWKLAPSLALLVPDRPEAVGRGPDETAIQTKERTGTVNNLRARAAETARTCYYFALATAKVSAAREAQPDVDPIDASWISDRN